LTRQGRFTPLCKARRSARENNDGKSMSKTLLGLWLLLLAIPSLYARDWDGEVIKAAQRNFPEFLDLLAIPDVADNAADIQRNAAFLQQAFGKRGFKTQLLTNPANRPQVFAELATADAGAKTILWYIHFDGQPVIPEEWAQKSPFDPVVKRRDDHGAWQEVARDRLLAQPFEPELRVFARASSDDKAPIMMLLTAVDMLEAQGRHPASNIKVVLDSEEEISSPNLAGVVKANAAAFKADALVILDGPVHGSGRPTLVFGNRGIAQATFIVYGPRAPLHSGHFGNYVPNPALRLAALLASMKDDSGRVLVEGYYDGVTLTADDRAVLAATGDDEAALLKRTGIARAESVGATYQESLQYPSLNVRGMASAAVGAKAANIVPSEATAELDLRTTPEADGRRLFGLIRRHIEKQGYHLTDGPPSDTDRAKYDKLASFQLGSVQSAERTSMDSPIAHWATVALKSATGPDPGHDPARIRMMGGTVPTDVLVDALHLPFIGIPTVNPDNNQHTHDENLRIGNFVSGTQTLYSLLVTPYR
jgi:acetylornithine deacetylase/succinyl-diaminopimelate desuccinylase-like protein